MNWCRVLAAKVLIVIGSGFLALAKFFQWLSGKK